MVSAEGGPIERSSPDERRVTSQPPSDSEIPSEELLDADGLDIDALLPATFESGSSRISMGLDLADLLRAAEERLEARSEPSRSLDAPVDDAGTLVPVPDDVLALLAEPLEGNDDDSPTGAHAESVAGATSDGALATPHGMEEDLEQPLPRASDAPRATGAGPVTGSGRADLSSEAPRAAATRPGDPDAPIRGETRAGTSERPVAPPQERGAWDRGPPSLERGAITWELGVTSPDRAALSQDLAALSQDRAAATWERAVTSPDRAALSQDRAAVTWERATSQERGPLPPASDGAVGSRDRGAMRTMEMAALERPAPGDRGAMRTMEMAALERPAPGDRGAMRTMEMAALERPAPGDRGAMRTVEMAALERPAPGDRGAMRPVETAALERPAPGDRGAMRPVETAAHERPAPGDRGAMRAAERSELAETGPRPAARIEPHDAGSRVRAAPTETMPAVLGPGDAARALGRAIAARVSGALLVTSDDDQRRILLHDGDVVTAGSSSPVESLVAFLAARGDLDRDLVPRMAGKLPAFGRHAGAALVAHGHLGQDDLWPVLRAHSEWIIGRALLVESGTCELEADPPARFKAEPSVFGGATGAEVFVDVVQRVVAPETALARLGGHGARLAQGSRASLLGECALDPVEEDAVRAAPGRTVHELTGDGPTDRWSVLHALVCLDVLEVLAAVTPAPRREESKADPLDEEALRQRVRARLALVEEGDYFALLGVPRAATSYEIRRAYLDLRRALEPARVLTAGTADLAGDLRLVLEVVEEAYEILRDARRRDRYRRAIEAGPPR